MEMGLEVETASEVEVALEVAADEKQADYMAVTRTLARLRSLPVRV